jgi:hypothetical protein
LGLGGDTKKDEISVYVKFNYGKEKKGAYMEDSADLSCPEANLPDQITLKLLWRITQGQYDPFSLLCVYMVN